MYSLVVVLGVAALESHNRIWRIVVPLSVVGASIAGYHSVLQATTASCTFAGSCTVVQWQAPVLGLTIPEAARHDMDVTNVAPAERHTIEFTADADPRIYLMHCHKVNHVMNGTFYPGGMLTGVVYRSVMDTDIFNQPMEYAGYSA